MAGVEVDHYAVLGLPSGVEGAKLSEKDISRAYKSKALELHPDKRPGDPNARSDFQRLLSSYEVLKDGKARSLFNDLCVKREWQARKNQYGGAKRRKMASDLEARERAAVAPDPLAKAKEEEERIARKLREEIAKIREEHSTKPRCKATAPKNQHIFVSRLAGMGHKNFEDFVLKKLQKVAERQT